MTRAQKEFAMWLNDKCVGTDVEPLDINEKELTNVFTNKIKAKQAEISRAGIDTSGYLPEHRCENCREYIKGIGKHGNCTVFRGATRSYDFVCDMYEEKKRK